MTIKLESTSFEQGGMIPRRSTCYTENKKGISPELHWDNVPEEAKSLVLICDDPDAVSGTNVHWLIYDLPPQTRRLPEGIRRLPKGARCGKNSRRTTGYYGPCPPEGTGTHHYFFKLYALDRIIGEATAEELIEAMKDHILDQGVLVGHYRWDYL
ncbi:MAG TPA: YbhB/YbcL family Raf kinase inhibitor-like protein [Pyrinomonadaceae bacterium]|nr:YbhB/YbcL family Raf kinase inhibitor-like protein [Pyrinomonadaceae bacterium]